MDYLYENLGDERFQEFCNSLVANEFPDTQSFPVGQPDGGRDSLAYLMHSAKKEFIVFQVKFVRNPNSITDIHKWFTETIEGEAPKISKLIPRGAIKYYLLTNVRGTAHLESGSKDKVNNILEKNIKIPSICWWRDDISRLLEKNPIFKWSFPEILNGQDVLNSALFQNINESKEKRESVIRAYLADQYLIDNKVKFKQIDLENKLFDLFTDVPIRIRKYNDKNKALRKTLEQFENHSRRIVSIDDRFLLEERDNYGAASFLLHPKIQTEIEKVLLEGGPGQGKSTISQYICQVHRARLLNKFSDLTLLPSEIKNTPIRLPFKIDLRHIAAWVDNKNPYQSRLNDEFFNKIWKNSLESFLIGHIIYHAQLDDFESSDLVAILRLSSVLFVFDGFDEIADVKIRSEVIDFINKGINRINENTKSIQVVITSRPAAFSDTIGFSVDSYPHFELTDITPTITKEYVDKWVKASRLDSKEANEIKRLVDEKLTMPHLRELAKSPMQLAIFISLLRTRGESLPNKRTALYDSYIELFFNRESEKNTTIRDHRDLIIDIHQYLAWVLHSEAELYNNSGSIHIDELKRRLKLYLSKEGHKTDIADNLFHVLEERVCALVSRVQGTYEFEVQPLREYFCARYLYNTSPYSPVGSPQNGTKPDRFDAIARNFYWHNVVRFYTGCFDRGELPMLIQKIKELQEDEILKFTNYPRLLTSQILSDWVFTQYPLLMKDVVKIIIDGINIGSIINQEGYRNHNEPILLPNDCGRFELIQECFNELKKLPLIDYASELIGIIRNNPLETIKIWTEHSRNISNEALTKWLEYAYLLGIIHKIDEGILINILVESNEIEKPRRLQLIIDGKRLELIDNNNEFKRSVLSLILEGKIDVTHRTYTEHSFHFLTAILHPYLLLHMRNSDETAVSFLMHLTKRTRRYEIDDKNLKAINSFNIKDSIDNELKAFSDSIETCLNKEVSIWRTSIEPWDILIEKLRNQFGEHWAIEIVAVIAAGIKSKSEIFDNYDNFNDNNLSLAKRVRYARLKSGNSKYWKENLTLSANKALSLLTFIVWATPKTIIELYDFTSEFVKKLCLEDYNKIDTALKRITLQSSAPNYQNRQLEAFLKSKFNDKEYIYLFSYRLNENSRYKLISNCIQTSDNKLRDVNDIKLTFLLENFLNSKEMKTLNDIKAAYNKLSNLNERIFNRGVFHHRNEDRELPIEIAREIMKDVKSYPRLIASIAERTCRLYANKNVKQVGKIAQDDNWFE
jgi:hypothetical protein